MVEGHPSTHHIYRTQKRTFIHTQNNKSTIFFLLSFFITSSFIRVCIFIIKLCRVTVTVDPIIGHKFYFNEIKRSVKKIKPKI